MADITNHLKKIKSARYGEDVRDAIHDAIELCYTDGQWNKDGNVTGMVDLLARQEINKIVGRSTGNVVETRIWPSADTDIYSDDYDGAWYNGQSLRFEYETAPGVYGTNVNADFDYIFVYYKPVVTASPELHIFKASTNYREGFGAATVVGGVYFGYDNESTKTGKFAMMKKINIYTNPNADDPMEFILDGVRAWRYDGSSDSPKIIDVASTMSTHHAGTIFQITGVKFASINDAIDTALNTRGFGKVEDGTLIL